MPYCRQCGRLLQDGEACSCTAENTQQDGSSQPQNGYMNEQQPYQNGAPQYQGQPYPQQGFAPNGYPYPYYGQPMPPQKKSKSVVITVIIVLSVVFLLFIAVLAAIFVPAMLGYAKKSRMASANSLASSIYRAANTALVEMDELYENTGGIYIISSDEKKNMDVPFDIDEFNKHFGQYTDNEKMEKQNYFMVVKNGAVEYAAVSEDWTNTKKIVGTYPVSTIDGTRIYTSDGSYSLSTERRSLSYLYDKAQEAVNEMIIKQYLEDKR